MHTITSLNNTTPTAPPTLTTNNVIVIKINAINANIVNNIILITLLSIIGHVNFTNKRPNGKRKRPRNEI